MDNVTHWGICVVLFLVGMLIGRVGGESSLKGRAIQANVGEYNPTNGVFQFKTNHLTSPNNPAN